MISRNFPYLTKVSILSFMRQKQPLLTRQALPALAVVVTWPATGAPLAPEQQDAATSLSQITKQTLINQACEISSPNGKGPISAAKELIVRLAAKAPTDALSEARLEVEAAEDALKGPDWTNACPGIGNPQTEEEKQILQETMKQRAAEAQRKADLAAKDEAERDRLTAIRTLREFDRFDFCNAYGNAIRGEVLHPFSSVPTYKQLFEAEAARRKVTVNRSMVKAEQIRIGMDQCTLYAAWGYPKRQNRSVGPWGVNLQLIYGDFGPYVYVRNGVITSFQD